MGKNWKITVICSVVFILQIIAYIGLKPLFYHEVFSDFIYSLYIISGINTLVSFGTDKVVNWIIHLTYCLFNFLFTAFIVRMYYKETKKLKASSVIYLLLVVFYVILIGTNEIYGLSKIAKISNDISYLISSPLVTVCIIPFMKLYKIKEDVG